MYTRFFIKDMFWISGKLKNNGKNIISTYHEKIRQKKNDYLQNVFFAVNLKKRQKSFLKMVWYILLMGYDVIQMKK